MLGKRKRGRPPGSKGKSKSNSATDASHHASPEKIPPKIKSPPKIKQAPVIVPPKPVVHPNQLMTKEGKQYKIKASGGDSLTYTELSKCCLGNHGLYNIYGVIISASAPHLIK